MIKFKVSDKPISGFYSFSASNEIITLSSVVRQFSEEELENIKAEATLARENYIAGVNKAKESGEKVSPATIKAKAVQDAKATLTPQRKARPNLKVTSNPKVFDEEFEDPVLSLLKEDSSVSLSDMGFDENPFGDPEEDDEGYVDPFSSEDTDDTPLDLTGPNKYDSEVEVCKIK